MLHPPLLIEIWSPKSRFPLSFFSRFHCATLIKHISTYSKGRLFWKNPKLLHLHLSYLRRLRGLAFREPKSLLISIVPLFLWFKFPTTFGATKAQTKSTNSFFIIGVINSHIIVYTINIGVSTRTFCSLNIFSKYFSPFLVSPRETCRIPQLLQGNFPFFTSFITLK